MKHLKRLLLAVSLVTVVQAFASVTDPPTRGVMSGKPQKFVSQPADNNQLKLDDARLAKLKGEVAKKMSATDMASFDDVKKRQRGG